MLTLGRYSSAAFHASSSNNDNNNPFCWEDDDADNPQEPPQLGIDFGVDILSSMEEEEFQRLKEECARWIDSRIHSGIDDLQKLADKWQRDLKHQQEPLEQAMTLNGMRESKRFNDKVDLLIGTFLNSTSLSREQTHQLAFEDLQRLQALEREKERLENKSETFHSWKETNDEYDDWEDDWW